MHKNEWSQCVNKWQEHEKHEFGKFALTMFDLPSGWKIRVFVLLTKVVMMIWMINTKTECWWDAHSNVAENGEGFINKNTFMSGPMSKIMNKTMACVGDSSSKNIANNEKDWPWWIFHKVCEEKIKRNKEDSEYKTVGFSGNK